MIAAIALLKRFWPVLAGVAAVGGLWLWVAHYGSTREQEGRSAVQAQWDAVSAANKAKQDAEDIENRRANAALEQIRETEFAAIVADRDGLSRRLLAAQGHNRALQNAYRELEADAAGAVSAGQAEAARRLGELRAAGEAVRAGVGQYDSACRIDAVVLTDLQAEIRPWVRVE